jgi:tRNA A37 threonylcarbamoyladenosine modification protein TsaB
VRDPRRVADRIRRGTALLAVVMLSASIPPSSADEVYKSVDAEGHVVYSDRAPSAKAQKSEVRVTAPDEAQARRNASEQRILDAEDSQRKHQQAVETSKKAQQDQQTQQKQSRCNVARDHYNSIKDVNILYHLDADGNRVFYTDAEAEARREVARQAMTIACAK